MIVPFVLSIFNMMLKGGSLDEINFFTLTSNIRFYTDTSVEKSKEFSTLNNRQVVGRSQEMKRRSD